MAIRNTEDELEEAALERELDEQEEEYVEQLEEDLGNKFGAELAGFLALLIGWSVVDIGMNQVIFDMMDQAIEEADTGLAFVDDVTNILLTETDYAASKAGDSLDTLRVPIVNTDALSTGISNWVSNHVGEMITGISETTRGLVADLIQFGIDENWNIGTFTDALTNLYGGFSASTAEKQGRAEMIARTEVAMARNHGTLAGYQANGINEVNVSDGVLDAPCEAANGSVWTIEHAFDNLLSHPSCTRAFSAHLP